ncbi:hypothetical protein FOA52_013489 [Chlamydomonas sp. UWO 241]|nr:hypothetical protein FOA52_013489 [Chlamydomonas sp. UWO 241]
MGQNKTQALCRWFEIPDSETLLDEFHCALRKRFLLQGRLYVFDHHVCFSTNLFGYVRKVVLPFSSIVAVRKKRHFRFPNSIEIEDDRGKRDFFTSFLARENAYRLIAALWSHPGGAAAGSETRGTPDGFRGRSAGTSMRRATTGDTDWQLSGNDEGGSAAAAGRGRGRAGAAGSRAGHPPLPPHHSRSSGVDGGTAQDPNEDDDDGDDGEEDDAGGGDVWAGIEAGPLPERHQDSKLLMSVELPATPQQFYEVLLSNRSHFMEDVLEEQGNRRINITSWKRAEQLGHIRDVQFTSPIKGAFSNWGVSHTSCYVSQRFARYEGDVVLYEAAQTNMDIPYGDCFTVNTRWEIRPSNYGETGLSDGDGDPFAALASADDIPRITVDIYLRVPFTRMCLFRKVIEAGTFKQVKENYLVLIERVREVLEEAAAARAAAGPATQQQCLSGRQSDAGGVLTGLQGAAAAVRSRLSFNAAALMGGSGGPSSGRAASHARVSLGGGAPSIPNSPQPRSEFVAVGSLPGRGGGRPSGGAHGGHGAAARRGAHPGGGGSGGGGAWAQLLSSGGGWQLLAALALLVVAGLQLRALWAVGSGAARGGGGGGGGGACCSTGGGSGGGDGASREFWAARLTLLRRELELLQARGAQVAGEAAAAEAALWD